MDSVVYDGKVVGSCVSDMKGIVNRFDSLSGSIKTATNKIVSARGFNEYIGGITSDSFSSYVGECGKAVSELSNTIRQKEVSILAYTKDEKAINTFLDSLSNQDYQSLDLSEIDQYISFGRRVGNFFKGVGSSIATAGLGLVEGIMDFGETGADLVRLGGTLFASIFTSTHDLLTGDKLTEKLWEDTKAVVSEKKVENLFNSFYSDSEIGRSIKENAYLFDGVRGVAKGLGYTGGLIGVNIVTGGLASGLGVGAAGSITAGQLAATAGVMGFANGTEEAWADGADINKGLLYGAAAGAWEGCQWYAGARINQYGGLGDRVASGIFKGAVSGVGTRIAMDTVDSGLEGFVQPALTMIYKDYGGNSFAENYSKAFEAAGGWSNVATQAVMGGIASAFSEFTGARKLLKEDKKLTAASEVLAKSGDMSDEEAIAALTTALGGDEEAAKRIFASRKAELAGLGSGEDLFFDAGDAPKEAGVAGGDYSKSRKYTIDGQPVASSDSNPFTTQTGSFNKNQYSWFEDGAYVPADGTSGRGIFKGTETFYSASEMMKRIEANKAYLTGQQYTDLMKAAKIFESVNAPISTNALKLIVSHSEGNVGRIKSALLMSYGRASEDAVDDLATKLARELFPTSTQTSTMLRRNLMDQYVDGLRAKGKDNWGSYGRMLSSMDSEELIRMVASESGDDLLRKASSYFGGQLSDDTLRRIAASDGYPATIRKILVEDGVVPEYMLDTVSVGGASKIFQTKNTARLKATSEVGKFNFDTAVRLTGGASGSVFDQYSELLKATNLFENGVATRRTYYYVVDSLMESGMSMTEAVNQARLMNMNAMSSVGMSQEAINRYASRVFSSKTGGIMYQWNDDVMDTLSNAGDGKAPTSSYMQRKYGLGGGAIDYNGVIDDFSTTMRRKISAMDTSSAVGGGNVEYSRKATQLFMDSYIEAARDVNNPNRGEAIRFMSKILELEDQGKNIRIFNNNGATGSHYGYDGKINLAFYTVDGKNVGTVFHENGHLVFGDALGSQVPSGFDSVRRGAVASLESSGNADLLKRYQQNTFEADVYSGYLADKGMIERLRQHGYSGFDDYKKALMNKYSQMTSVSQRSDALGSAATKSGLYTGESYTPLSKKLDFKDVENLAEYQISTARAKVKDRIYRSQYGSYTTTSGIIDSTTLGRRTYSYGHGPNYFARGANPNYDAYHELIADYSALKVAGDNRSIRFLRSVLGDDLINMLDNTYQQMLR